MEADLTTKGEEIIQAQADLEQAQEDEKTQYAAMKLRIKYMYEAGDATALESLVSSEDFSDLLSKAEYVQSVHGYDRDKLEEYVATKQKIADLKEQLETEQSQLESMQTEYETEESNLTTLIDSKQAEVADLDSQIQEAAEKAAKEEEERQKKAEEEAAAAVAAQQAAAEAEAEAARKQAAEAEAARVAAAEAANAAAKADTDTSSSSGSSSSDSSASSTTTESPSASDTSSSSSSGTYLGRFKLTGYCSCSICTGQWSGGSTASGTTPTAGRTIAMGGVPFGTKLMINGQVYTVEDRGTAYGHVDIFCSSHSEALSFGVQYADVYQLS